MGEERGEFSALDNTVGRAEGEVVARGEGGATGDRCQVPVLGDGGHGGPHLQVLQVFGPPHPVWRRWRALGGRGGGELEVLEKWERREVLWMGEVVKDLSSP